MFAIGDLTCWRGWNPAPVQTALLHKVAAMDTNKKPAPGWNRETGLTDAFDSSNHTPFELRLKALLLWMALHDAALLALLALILWGVLV